ncbi:hypothetical protein MMC13_001229 [Lambiella insularis]|nr:hypothetical protein [Lambiella insularis]
MYLLDLPNEVLHLICKSLEEDANDEFTVSLEEDIKKLSSTCRYFHGVLGPALFRNRYNQTNLQCRPDRKSAALYTTIKTLSDGIKKLSDDGEDGDDVVHRWRGLKTPSQFLDHTTQHTHVAQYVEEIKLNWDEHCECQIPEQQWQHCKHSVQALEEVAVLWLLVERLPNLGSFILEGQSAPGPSIRELLSMFAKHKSEPGNHGLFAGLKSFEYRHEPIAYRSEDWQRGDMTVMFSAAENPSTTSVSGYCLKLDLQGEDSAHRDLLDQWRPGHKLSNITRLAMTRCYIRPLCIRQFLDCCPSLQIFKNKGYSCNRILPTMAPLWLGADPDWPVAPIAECLPEACKDTLVKLSLSIDEFECTDPAYVGSLTAFSKLTKIKINHRMLADRFRIIHPLAEILPPSVQKISLTNKCEDDCMTYRIATMIFRGLADVKKECFPSLGLVRTASLTPKTIIKACEGSGIEVVWDYENAFLNEDSEVHILLMEDERKQYPDEYDANELLPFLED